MRILFVHLLNNFTGSPRVLANFLEEYTGNGDEIHLLTSNTEGCLSNINGIIYHKNFYSWKTNKILLTGLFIISQIYQFFFVLFGKKYDCVYINTILPFGAAFAAKLRKEKIIYHVHEYYPKPHLMQKICVYFLKKTSNKTIFVSQYLESCYKDLTSDKIVIHNSVSKKFHEDAGNYIGQSEYLKKKYKNRLIVLPCALKTYKGVLLFLEIAKQLQDYNFLLVTSNSEEETNDYFKNEIIPKNFKIMNEVKDMAKIYSSASLVMNLSIPHGIDRFIETFSMILIEAFEFKTPCIAPCYGGPLEIIENDLNGYLMEIENIHEVTEKIKSIFLNYEDYTKFCEKAYTRAEKFSPSIFLSKINETISKGQ